MSRGCPLVASDRGAIPEVAGGAALLVDPFDEVAIQRPLERLAHEPDLRRRLADLGGDRTTAFSWSTVARGTANAYETALTARLAADRVPA
jgi:glycosyltransferase involved in cell wall biosynthesis